MKQTDSFTQPMPSYSGVYPNFWAGYVHLQPRTADVPPRPDLRHLGDDYNGAGAGNADEGARVEAIAPGVIEKLIPWNGKPGFGNHMFIRHEVTPELKAKIKQDYGVELGDNRVIYSHYAHLKQMLAPEGMEVDKGQLVATVGKTGTIWAHLHCEIRKATGLGYESYPSERPVSWINQYYLPTFLAIEKYKTPVTPPHDPCAEIKKQLAEMTNKANDLQNQLNVSNDKLRKIKEII